MAYLRGIQGVCPEMAYLRGVQGACPEMAYPRGVRGTCPEMPYPHGVQGACPEMPYLRGVQRGLINPHQAGLFAFPVAGFFGLALIVLFLALGEADLCLDATL